MRLKSRGTGEEEREGHGWKWLRRDAKKGRGLFRVVFGLGALMPWVGEASVPFSSEPFDIARGSVKGVTSVQLADLNGDQLLDIAVFEGGKHADGRRTFAWFEAPNWDRREFNEDFAPGPFVGDSAFADLDGDGDLDLVLPEDPHSGSGTGYLYWYENPGMGARSAWDRHLIGSWSGAVHIGDIDVGDIDGDGRVDVAIRHLSDKAVRLCFNNLDGTWTTRRLPVGNREGLMLGDLDRNGRLDIVLNGYWWACPSDPRMDSFQEFSFDPAFYTQPISGLNNSTKGALGDVDGDGRVDIVMVSAEGQKAHLAWYRSPEEPRTQSWERTIIEGDWGNMHQAQLADMDRDGDLDIVGGLSFGSKGIFIWFNERGGSEWSRQTLSSGYGLYYGVVGDIGGDGDMDIVGPSTYSFSSVPLLWENQSAALPIPVLHSIWIKRLEPGVIELEWDPIESADGNVVLERSAGGGDFEALKILAPEERRFVDETFGSGGPFLYRLRSVPSGN